VTIRPSPRDPTLTEALARAAADPAIRIVDDRDIARVEAGEIHIYGRSEVVDAVRKAARPGVVVRGHGTGMGVAVVTCAADVREAARAIADDVVLFDQRGCLSPRVALVEGRPDRAESLARALDEVLEALGERVGRGALSPAERQESIRWTDTLAFAGGAWSGAHHVVALGTPSSPLLLPPPGRHVLVAAVASLGEAAARIAPFARYVVAIGSDDAARMGPIAPPHARLSPLGRMQHPAFDGPVDRRDALA
jgi:pimeloyl-ACP methyl ester carboxylesterase